MQPMWFYAGHPVDVDDTNWCISSVDTDARDPLNPETYQQDSLSVGPAAAGWLALMTALYA